MVAVVGGVGKVGVVHRRADDGVPGGTSGGFFHGGSSGGFSLNVVNGEVSGGHAETHGVRDVVDGLDEAVGVDVAVGSAGNTVGSLDLLLD